MCEDAFPKSIDFEKMVKAIFEVKAQEAFEGKGESKQARKLAEHILT